MLKLLLALVIVALVLIALRIVTGTSVSVFIRRWAGPMLCAVGGHRRDGSTVRRTEQGYHARCRRCDARLFKRNRQDDWGLLDPAAAGRRTGEGGQREDDGSNDAYSVDAREEGSA